MSNNSNSTATGCKDGIGIGTVVAAIISWSLYHSIFWVIIHGFFGWAYVIYYLLTR